MSDYSRNTITDALVDVINEAYRATRRDGTSHSSAGKRFQKDRITTIFQFCRHNLCALTEDEERQLYEWTAKWPIHPGEFKWGVDWSSITAERIVCPQCKGEGSWKYESGGHLHTEHCADCGGRGYQNRARRGMYHR